MEVKPEIRRNGAIIMELLKLDQVVLTENSKTLIQDVEKAAHLVDDNRPLIRYMIEMFPRWTLHRISFERWFSIGSRNKENKDHRRFSAVFLCGCFNGVAR